MNYFPGLAKNLRDLRKSQRWSLRALAKEAGISKTYLWEIEQDHLGEKSPSAWTVWRLACVLRVSMEDLICVDDPRTIHPRTRLLHEECVL